MVVDKYAGRCLDVGSTPTGSIDNLHCFVNLSKTLFLQRFLFYTFYSFPNLFETNRPKNRPFSFGRVCFYIICLKINIVCEFLTDIILSLFGDVRIDVHGCF